MVSVDVKFRCFVEGLSWAIDDQALERAFSLYNDILESKVRWWEYCSLEVDDP